MGALEGQTTGSRRGRFSPRSRYSELHTSQPHTPGCVATVATMFTEGHEFESRIGPSGFFLVKHT